MWKRIWPPLILASVALNVAFVSVWAAHTLRSKSAQTREIERKDGVWCPLHRRLGITGEQWRDIEPRLVAFQEASRRVCDEVNHVRGDMIDLIFDPAPDREAIREKQDEILAGQKRLQGLVIEHLLAEKAVLTLGQQEELFRLVRRQSACAGHGPMMSRMGRSAARPADSVREGEQ